MEMDNIEKRYVPSLFDEPTIANGGMVVSGYAAVFNSWSNDLGGFVEKIDPNAFSGILGKRDVRALVDHDWSKVIGRESAGTLILSVDDKGLRYRVELPENTLGQDLAVSIKRGDIQENSFAFIVGDDEWRERPDGTYERIITSIADLIEVSIVSMPAYDDARIGQRSLEGIKKVKEEAIEAAKKKEEERKIMLEKYELIINDLKNL
jgi:HK97 family phage prohead protease